MKYTKEILTRMYVDEKLSMSRIAKALGGGSGKGSNEAVRKALIRHNIPIRPKGCIYPEGRKHDISKEDLNREYTDNGKTQEEIAIMFGCGSTLISTLMQRYGIESRPRDVALKGIKRSKESRERMSASQIASHRSGRNNGNWKGGRSFDLIAIRNGKNYANWRKWILRIKGDFCESCGKDLNAACPCCNHRPDRHVHHIKSFADHPELRSDPSNGLVLCEACHLKLHRK